MSPEIIPKVIPVRAYIKAIFHPNNPPIITKTTSFTRGEVVKNANAIPIGILAFKNPMNKGILEQEQNGLIAPKSAARTYPITDLVFVNFSCNL